MKRLPILFVMAAALAGFAATAFAAAPAGGAAAAAAAAVTLPAVAPTFPAPIVHVLPNGMRVAVFPDSRVPIVQMQLLVPAGAAAEPDTLPGIAALTAGLINQGTSSRSAEQFASELAALGATFSASASRDYAQVACGARATGFEAAIELMSDAAINSVLADEAFAQSRRTVAQQLGLQRQSATAVADDRVWAAAFGDAGYGHSPAGDIQSLLATNREHLAAFYRSRWRPDRAVLTISGDITPDRALVAATEWFGRWSGRTSGDVQRPAPAHHGGVQVVDLAGARWSEARLAWVGPGRVSAELPAWQVFVAGLEQSALPAGARVSFQPLRDASLLVVSAGGPTDSIPAVVRRVRDAVRTYAAHPPAGAALETLRRRVAQAWPLTLETMGAYASQWHAFDFAGQDAGAIARYHERLATVADLGGAAKTVAQQPMLLVAGPGDVLREKLAAFGDVGVSSYHRAPIAQVDTLAAPTPEQARRGKAAIAAAVVAHGGAAKLRAVHTTVYEGEMTIYARDQEIGGQFSLVRIDPDRLSFATKMLEFENRQVLVRDSAWTLTKMDSASVMEVDSAGIAALRATHRGDLVRMLRDAIAPGVQAARRGSEIVRGRTCDLVDIRTPEGLRWRFVIDAVTHRIQAVDSGLGPDLKWHERRVLSQMESVSGLLIPYVEERYTDGERVSRFTTSVAGINRTIDPTLFARPRVIRGVLLPD